MPVGPYTQIISDEIFTDRREFLDRWFQRILGTPRLAMMSHAFIGRRRMGKTAEAEALLRQEQVLFSDGRNSTLCWRRLGCGRCRR